MISFTDAFEDPELDEHELLAQIVELSPSDGAELYLSSLTPAHRSAMLHASLLLVATAQGGLELAEQLVNRLPEDQRADLVWPLLVLGTHAASDDPSVYNELVANVEYSTMHDVELFGRVPELIVDGDGRPMWQFRTGVQLDVNGETADEEES